MDNRMTNTLEELSPNPPGGLKKLVGILKSPCGGFRGENRISTKCLNIS